MYGAECRPKHFFQIYVLLKRIIGNPIIDNGQWTHISHSRDRTQKSIDRRRMIRLTQHSQHSSCVSYIFCYCDFGIHLSQITLRNNTIAIEASATSPIVR